MSLSLLEQAKDGDTVAIATLMNQALQPKGIAVRCDRQGTCLQLWLTGQTLPPQAATVAYVRRGMDRLQVASTAALQIYAEQADHQEPGWGVEVALGVPTAEVKPLALATQPASLPPSTDTSADTAEPTLDARDATEPPSSSADLDPIAAAYGLLGLALGDSLQSVSSAYFKLKALTLREGDRIKVETLKQAFHLLKEHLERSPAQAEEASEPGTSPSSDPAQTESLTGVEQVAALLKQRRVPAEITLQGSQLNIAWLAVRVSNPEDAASQVHTLLTHPTLAAMGLDGVATLVISGLNRDQSVAWQQTCPVAKR
jgi:hypothetical protein